VKLCHLRHFNVFGGFPLSLPSRELAFDVGLFTSEIAKTDCVDVDVVNRCENADE
jgi:hypothetical protein